MDKPKIHSQTRQTDNKGNASFGHYCAFHKPQMSWRPIAVDDIGIDGEVEIYTDAGERTGKIIKVQLKSSESATGYIKNESKDKFTFYADKRDIEYWQKVDNDVVLVIFDSRDGSGKLYAKKIDGVDIAAIKTKSYPVKFDKSADLIEVKKNDFIERFYRKKNCRKQSSILPVSFPIYAIL